MGKWFVNDLPLSRYAYAIRNRGASWRVAAKRGENPVVAGRSGSIHSAHKPSEDGTVGMEMWAVGCDFDGSFPEQFDRRMMTRQNLDLLSRIFGSGALLELARTEDDSVQYGRRNVVWNPQFEIGEGDAILAENSFWNPSAEHSSDVIPIRENLAKNPEMTNSKDNVAIRTNLVLNPRFQAAGLPVVSVLNLVKNPSAEVSTKYWKGVSNSTLARVRTKIGGAGQYVLRSIAKAAGAHYIEYGPATAKAGTSYTGQAKYKNNTGVTRTLRIYLRYYNKKGTYLSQSYAEVSVPAKGVGTLTVTGTAPAGTTRLNVRLGATGGAKGEQIYFDEVMVTTGSTVLAYFDGSTKWGDGVRYRWRDTAGLSYAEQYRIPPKGWQSSNFVGMTDLDADVGRYSAYCVARNNIAEGANLLRQIAAEACGIGTAGVKVVSGSVSVRLPEIDEASKEVRVKIECFDAKGASLGFARTAAGGPDDAFTDTTIESGSWTLCAVDGAYTLAGTTKVGIWVGAGAAYLAGDGIYVGNPIVELASVVGEWFDGSMTDTDTFDFQWAGKAHASVSRQAGRIVVDWTGTPGSVAYRVQHEDVSAFCIEAVPVALTTGIRLGVQQSVDPKRLRAGHTYTLSSSVRVNRDQNVKATITVTHADGTQTVTTGALVPAVAGEWLQAAVTAPDFPDDAVAVTIAVSGNATPQGADTLNADMILFERAGVVRDFFDGDSGDDYVWETEFGYSQYLAPQADGWTPFGDAFGDVYQDASFASAGSFSAVAVASQPGANGITNGTMPVEAGTEYTVRVAARPDVGRTISVGIVWLDANNEIITTSASGTAVAADTWGDAHVTAAAPEGAVVGQPYAVALASAANEKTWFDLGRMTRGTDATYKDGDSGSGWRWVAGNEPGHGPSEVVGLALPNWQPVNGTLVQTDEWAYEGDFSGLFETIGTVAPYVMPKYDVGERYPEAEEGMTYTANVQVRARDAVRVYAEIRGVTFDGYTYDVEDAPAAVSEPVDLDPGEVTKLIVKGTPAPYGRGISHLQVRVYVISPGSESTATVGLGAYIDQFCVSTDDYTDFIDGSKPWVEWLGEPNASESRVYGPARRALIDVKNAIDMSSMAGGTRAEFTVEAEIPSTYWEDTYETTKAYPVHGDGAVIHARSLDGTTAPIDDAVIRVHGPFKTATLTDAATGSWLTLDFTKKPIVAGQTVVVDCSDWTVRDAETGRSLISNARHGGSLRLLPLTVEPRKKAPRVVVTGTGFGAGTAIEITARRRYHVA